MSKLERSRPDLISEPLAPGVESKNRAEEDKQKIAELRRQLGIEQVDLIAVQQIKQQATMSNENRQTPNPTEGQRMYSAIAEAYDLMLWVTGYKVAVRYFIRQIPFRENQPISVLDAGSGTGLYTFALLDKFPQAHVTAFDFNRAMIEQMQRSIQRKGLSDRVQTFTGDVTKPIPEIHQQFDLIITGGVLEYVNPEEAVKNLSQYLKPGGYFLNSPVKDNWLGGMAAKLYHFKPHSRGENINAFISNGYKLEKVVSLPIIKEAHIFQKL